MTYGARVASIVLLAMATACTSPTHWLEPKALTSIKNGTSTRAQVEQLLGTPVHRIPTQTGTPGTESAIYRTGILRQTSEPGTRTASAPTDGEYWTRTFSVVYDHDGVVQSQWLHENTLPVAVSPGIARWGSPAPLNAARTDPAVTPTRDACIHLLGTPFVEYLEPDNRRVLMWLRGQQTNNHWSYQNNEVFWVVTDMDGNVKERRFSTGIPSWLQMNPGQRLEQGPLVQKLQQ